MPYALDALGRVHGPMHMNPRPTHIVARVRRWPSCAARGTQPTDEGPEHKDYESVNGLISKVEKEMKAWMMTGLLKQLDLAFGPVDDIVAVWDVEKARDAAWVRAQVIWSLRGTPVLRDSYEAMNDRAVGFAGRALLMPVGLAG